MALRLRRLLSGPGLRCRHDGVAAQGVPAVRLPRSYLVWPSGAVVSQTGDAALYFALGWVASGHGGPAAGLVLSSISLPRTALLLVGGAAGDRLGARRIMITGNSTMLAVAAVPAAVSWHWGTPLALLVAVGLITGTVDAFCLPSSGSMPRQLVDDASLPRALALRQSGSQLASMTGGPLGAALVHSRASQPPHLSTRSASPQSLPPSS